MNNHVTSAEGRFAFTSQAGGEHQLCLRTTSQNFQGTQRTFVSAVNCLPGCNLLFAAVPIGDRIW